MKIFVLFFLSFYHSHSYTKFYYAEQWYLVFNQKLQKSSANHIRNIYFLEKALKSPFANPQYALAKINSKREWEKYQLLFKMHTKLLLVRENIALATLFQKREAKFYEAPFKKLILENLEKSEKLYKKALVYFDEALKCSEDLKAYSSLNLEDISFWEDENFRISEKSLDYFKIIERELLSLKMVREEVLKF